MRHDGFLLFLILLVNLILALLYLLVHIRKKTIKKGLIVFFVFLIFPGVGIAYMAAAELMNFIFHQLGHHDVLMDELSFSKERMKLRQDIDVEQQLNIVPVEEAMIVSGKKERRQTLIDVLKKDDYERFMENVKDAVSNDDMEVSHYAAAFVTDVTARYKSREAEYRKTLENRPTTDNLCEYIKYVSEIAASGVFPALDEKRYVEMLDAAAWKLWESEPDRLTDHTVKILSDKWSEYENEEMLQKWLKIAFQRSETSLECFKLYLQECYRRNDKQEFFRMLDAARHSQLSFDNETINWIRFFETKGEKNEKQA